MIYWLIIYWLTVYRPTVYWLMIYWLIVYPLPIWSKIIRPHLQSSLPVIQSYPHPQFTGHLSAQVPSPPLNLPADGPSVNSLLAGGLPANDILADNLPAIHSFRPTPESTGYPSNQKTSLLSSLPVTHLVRKPHFIHLKFKSTGYPSGKKKKR
jgi:hypothetical protein